MADGLLGDGGLSAAQFLLEPDDLPAVHGDALLRLPVGQLDDVDRPELSQHLIHLLLAVEVVSPTTRSEEVEEGTLVRLGETELDLMRGLTGSGADLLGIGDGLIRYGAQAYHLMAPMARGVLGRQVQKAPTTGSPAPSASDGQEGVSPLIGKLFKNFRQILFQFNHMLDPFFSHIP